MSAREILEIRWKVKESQQEKILQAQAQTHAHLAESNQTVKCQPIERLPIAKFSVTLSNH